MEKNLQQNDELQGLEDQEQWILIEIDKLRTKALECLEEDLGLFPERELKRRFLADMDFASSLTNQQIKSIKQKLGTALPGLLPRVIACLGDSDRWTAGRNFHGPGKSLAENETLWECIKPIEDFLVNLMDEYGFPKEEVRYKMPTWFIKHTYMPSIAEKYWQLVHDLEDVRQRKDELQKRLMRDKLSKKWDSA